MSLGAHKLIPESFTAVASHSPENAVGVLVVTELPADLDAVGYIIDADSAVPAGLGVDRDALVKAGFEGKPGQTIVLPQLAGPAAIIVAAGTDQTPAALRDAAAAFARAAQRYAHVGVVVGDAFALDPETLGRMVTEGVLLARYRYTTLHPSSTHVPLVSLDLVVDAGDIDRVTLGVHAGEIAARAANIARDLANTPPSHLTATDFGEIALRLGAERGLEVSVFDKQQIIEIGCGGLLGVNAGSVEEPRMIQLRYRPTGPDGSPLESAPHLAFVGKGIMYDSGGISLKPSDPMHLTMKMDMGGAAAVFGAMLTLKDLGCQTAVTAFLMCTDNMPSGSAMKLGDVLSIRGGKTVEVKNTDAEGRLVMSDALVLATEESPDAIVDIATLTGAALMALGQRTAALFGNDQALVDQVKSSAEATDESLWQLPLERRYRDQLNSDIADIANLGGKFAGATTAALFLVEFTGDIPWAHIDIAGTMQSDADDLWRPKGATGYGTRLLIDLAMNFTPSPPLAG